MKVYKNFYFMKDVKPYIDYLKETGTKKEDALKLLQGDKDLSDFEKNLIYVFCFPRPLLDMEFPKRIHDLRSKRGSMMGYLNPDEKETLLIIEAGMTDQYGRYIKHMMYSFATDPEKVFPVIGREEHDCGICYKKVLEKDLWNEVSTPSEKERQETLCFGSAETDLVICKDCLIQLVCAKNVIDFIDPSFLDWRLRGKINSKMLNCAWKNFKLL